MHSFRTVLVAACMACILALVAPPAEAELIGLISERESTVYSADLDLSFDCEAELGVEVCVVYGELDGPYTPGPPKNNNLLSVANSLITTNAPDGFYQNTAWPSWVPPPGPVVQVFPSILCDTYVTIGNQLDYPVGNDHTVVDPDFCTNQGYCPPAEIFGGWFNAFTSTTQGHPVLYPDGTYRVMLGRFAAPPGYVVSGTVDVFVLEDDAVIWHQDLSFTCGCPADLNHDNMVNGHDLAMLLGSWGPCENCEADMNGDGMVGAADLAVLLGTWTHSQPCD